MKKQAAKRHSGGDGSARGKLKSGMKKKLAGLFVCVVLALILLLFRITYINAVSGDQYARQVLTTSQSQYASVTMPYKRGDIIDCNGTVLATSEKTYNVILDCRAVNSRPEYADPTVEALRAVYGISPDTIRALLTDEKTKDALYKVILKNVSIEEKQAFDTYCEHGEDSGLSDEEKKNRANIRGVWFEEEYVRNYPLGSTACDVIGFVYDKDQADWGVESYYNSTLQGVDGRKYGYWDSGSDLGQTIVEPRDGDTVQLTIDTTVQEICDRYVEKFDDYFTGGPFSDTEGAKNIGILVMDPNDASILAMSSSRPYDLNDPRDLTPFYSDEQLESMSEDKKIEALNRIWRNYCISDTFEPGSVFKPVVVASALENGSLSGNDEFTCDGYQTVAGTRIKCSETEGHGDLTVGGVIANSCNDALMQIASGMGSGEFCKYQNLFRFGMRTGIDLSGEATGILHTEDTISEVDLATSSFGQGFTCTMIQEAAAMCAVINGGYYYKPHVISRVLDSTGSVKKNYGKILEKQVVSEEVSGLLRQYMVECAEEGTAQPAKVDCYSMGGKTGTAQQIPRGNGKYLLSFTGFAPAENPQVLVYVVVDEPNVEYQPDSRYAQWLGRDVMQEILPYLGLYPDEPHDPDDSHFRYDFDNKEGKTPEQLAREALESEDDEEEDEEDEDGEDYDEDDEAGEPVTETAADINVPEPQDTGDGEVEGGNTEETDGVTNEEAGIEEEETDT